MLNNQRMDSADQRALLLAALGRTLAAAAAAGINDPKLAELLATGLAQHQELTAGTGPDDVDRRSTCSGGPGQRLRSSAELLSDFGVFSPLPMPSKVTITTGGHPV